MIPGPKIKKKLKKIRKSGPENDTLPAREPNAPRAPGPWSLVPGPRAPGPWSQGPRVPGPWSLVLGPWSQAPGPGPRALSPKVTIPKSKF